MNDIRQKIIGTWKLVYSIEIDDKGNKLYPFGEDAIGYIMYDLSEKMSVQICRRGRENFIDIPKKAGVNISADYLAYFGNYIIDEENQTIQHLVEGSLFSDYIGKNLARKYHFYQDKMSLRPCEGVNHREILWQKI